MRVWSFFFWGGGSLSIVRLYVLSMTDGRVKLQDSNVEKENCWFTRNVKPVAVSRYSLDIYLVCRSFYILHKYIEKDRIWEGGGGGYIGVEPVIYLAKSFFSFSLSIIQYTPVGYHGRRGNQSKVEDRNRMLYRTVLISPVRYGCPDRNSENLFCFVFLISNCLYHTLATIKSFLLLNA